LISLSWIYENDSAPCGSSWVVEVERKRQGATALDEDRRHGTGKESALVIISVTMNLLQETMVAVILSLYPAWMSRCCWKVCSSQSWSEWAETGVICLCLADTLMDNTTTPLAPFHTPPCQALWFFVVRKSTFLMTLSKLPSAQPPN
jgi:hypothetical protein